MTSQGENRSGCLDSLVPKIITMHGETLLCSMSTCQQQIHYSTRMKRPRPLQTMRYKILGPLVAVAFLLAFLTGCSDAWQTSSHSTVRRSLSSLFLERRTYSDNSRRDFLSSVSAAVLLINPLAKDAFADDSATAPASPLYTRQSDKFGYTFQPPPSLSEGNKPLKTHLDEVNFFGSNGYQVGITIDPVRISSLSEFGTPSEVAAKVVLAEVQRDGVFNVKLMQDPLAGKQQDTIDYIQLDYLSEGKRGDKRFVCKFMIYKNMLYALTAQCKQQDYELLRGELLRAVDSFQVIV
jgi:hypothetical protein